MPKHIFLGVMLSEAVLEYPPVLMSNSSCYEINKDGERIRIRTGPERLQLAREYMELCEKYPPHKGGQGTGSKCIKMHLHRFLHADLQRSLELRDVACSAQTCEDMYKFIEAVDAFQKQIGHEVKYEELSWYMRYRVCDENGISIGLARYEKSFHRPKLELDDETCGSFAGLFGIDVDDDNF